MLVVADDLSGAVEVAAVLGARRIALGHADGDVIDLDTRELPPDEAARRSGRSTAGSRSRRSTRCCAGTWWPSSRRSPAS